MTRLQHTLTDIDLPANACDKWITLPSSPAQHVDCVGVSDAELPAKATECISCSVASGLVAWGFGGLGGVARGSRCFQLGIFMLKLKE